MRFLEELKQQRWDDHRYYHQSRVNQSLHFFSALSFISAYILLTVNLVAAVFIGWVVAMVSRQAGHFFFEPKGYDKINQATFEYKERIKVGYNLRRKVVLLSAWALSPAVLYHNPTLFGLLEEHQHWRGYLHNVAVVWLSLGIGALLFRTLHLFFIKDVQHGLVWLTKILTDPFHDILLYHKAPIYLLKGEKLDPMKHVSSSA